MDRNRNSRNMDRDERGRFTSDDYDSRGRSASHSREDQYGSRSSQYASRDRDDYDDDRGSRGSSGRSGNTSSRGDGRGWFGDPEGHSEASRRGWESHGRSSASHRDDYDDDRDRSARRTGSGRSSSGYDRDYNESRSSSGRDSGPGWFGESARHAEASRRGWENRDDDNRDDDSRRSRYANDRDRDDDRGPRGGRGGYDGERGASSRGRSEGSGQGWFGDSEGHRQAARRGWEDRDDNSRSARGRDEDRDRGSRDHEGRSRNQDNRSHGGWFGDSEGHSEAARRGWDDRR